MSLSRSTVLFFAPTRELVEASIVVLRKPALRNLGRKWWSDPALKSTFTGEPIDRYWDWSEMDIELEGKRLRSLTVAIKTSRRAVQGAMMISAVGVPSALEKGKRSLFVELLFTAPCNRPELRQDGQPFLTGIGTELLTWGCWYSRKNGHDGRIILDASPDFVDWYKRRGLQTLNRSPIVFEGVRYTPMEIDSTAANALLKHWDESEQS